MKRKRFYVRDAARPMIAQTRNTRDGAEVLAGFYPPGSYRVEETPEGGLRIWRTDADQTMDAARAAPGHDPKLAAINARNRAFYAR